MLGGESDSADDSSGVENIKGDRKGKGKQRAVEVVLDARGVVEGDGNLVETTVLPSKAEQKAKARAESKGQGPGRIPKKASSFLAGSDEVSTLTLNPA